MIKSTLNYKLINTFLIVFMIYLVYQTKAFWFTFINIIFSIAVPFLIAFMISYALYPILCYLIKKGLSKRLSIFIILFTIISIILSIIIFVVPSIFSQIGDIFGNIIGFFKKINFDYNLSFYGIEENIDNIFNTILEKFSKNISVGAVNMIGFSLSFITKVFIVFTAFIYFLIDMDKIRLSIKKFLKRKSKKIYRYVVILDIEMTKYLGGFLKIAIISFFEYFIIYLIIGHPNYFLLGTLASIGNLIPYFGGICVNIIAAITALSVSSKLFIKTIIIFVIFSMIDGYVINPYVFGKSNKLHPLIVILSVFSGGILFGNMGVIISLPLAIILISTYKYFKKDISTIGKKTIKKKRKI